MKNEDKVLRDIIRNVTPEKRIWIGSNRTREELQAERKADSDKASERLEMTKHLRMPWFCPKCDKVMKKRLDDKMWVLHRVCFDCVVEMEHELRVTGKFEKYENGKMLANAKSFIKDVREQTEDFIDKIDSTHGVNSFGEVDKYDGPEIDKEEVREKTKEYLDEYEKEVMKKFDNKAKTK